ncbi:outer membrane immunogenic protein [Bradyrhizobium sp. USDA 4503]
MKRLLLGTIVIILLVAAVADLAARLCQRSGSDIGINRGGGRRCWEYVNAGDVVRAQPPALTYPGATGGPLGGEIGFRWQIANSVFGIAVKGNCANPEDCNAKLVLPGLQDESQIVTGGPVKDPFGYTWNEVLVYVTGATTVARNKYRLRELATPLLLVNGSEGQRGGAAGVNVKLLFLPTRPSALSTIACSWALRSLAFAQPESQAFQTGAAGTARIGQDINIGLVHVN